MNVEDLRIGNYVIDSFNDVQKKVDVNDIAIAYKYQYLKLLSIPYEPIKLTEDWLEKFGFSDKEYKRGYIGIDNKQELSFVLQKPEFMGEWQTFYAFELPQSRFVEIEFVHQLQNLFYSIEGEDLVLR